MDSVKLEKHAGVAAEWTESSAAIVGLVVGIVLTVAGFAYTSDVLAAIGFLPLTLSFFYLNGMFWSWVYKGKDITQYHPPFNRYL